MPEVYIAIRDGRLRQKTLNTIEMPSKDGSWQSMTLGQIEKFMTAGMKRLKHKIPSPAAIRNYARVIKVVLQYGSKRRWKLMPPEARRDLKRHCPQSGLHSLFGGGMSDHEIRTFLDATPQLRK
jgi:hypothetical protein